MKQTLLKVLIATAALGLVCVFGIILWFNAQIPDLDTLKSYEPALITTVYDRHGELITEYSAERRIIVDLDRLPQHLIDAFVAAEDDKFYSHFGIDIFGIIRAAYKMVVAGRVKQGASTITQQVARSFFLTQQRKFSRKIKEILLALKLEWNFSKDEILFLYLNQIYLGRGAYGVAAASEMYFGIPPEELTVAQSALIAGLPPAPSRYAPHIAPEKARARQLYVLKRMLDTNRLSEEEEQLARNQRLGIIQWEAPSWNAPWIDSLVRQWLLERFPEGAVLQGGLRVYTSFDLSLQKAAQQAVRHGLENHDKRQGYRGPLTTLTDRATWPAAISDVSEDVAELIRDRELGGIVQWVGPEVTADVAPPRPVTAVLTANDTFRGVVTGITHNGNMAWIDFGFGVGRLPTEGMLWARTPDIEVAAGVRLVRRVSDQLSPGALVRVRKYAPEYVNRFGIREHDQNEAINALDTMGLDDDSPPGALLLLLEQQPVAQAALASLMPQSGEVVALVGGYDFASSQFNRAVQAKRQPGSAFKPIVYNAALDHDFTPGSILVDTPLVYQDAETEFRWKPKNYEGKFYGPMTLIDALTYSRNVVTIQLVQKLRIHRIKERARDLGISSDLPDDLSMALGSGVVTPLELARPYATFANLGRRPEVEFIREVWDASGALVYDYKPPVTGELALPFEPFERAPRPQRQDVPFGLRNVENVYATAISEFPQVISPETAYQTTYLLRNVVERGTGWRARAVGVPVVGKTGTTDDNIDSWFVGYSCRFVTSVWVGYDQLQSLGKYETGSRAAIPIWADYMTAAHQGLSSCDFEIPENIEFHELDAETGRPAQPWSSNKVLLVPFKRGTFTADGESTGAGANSNHYDLFQNPSGLMHRPSDW